MKNTRADNKSPNLSLSENKGYILPSEVNKLPDEPGVYLMKNSEGNVIYVGKAKNLKKRVSSYFQHTGKPVKTRMLVEHIAIIDYIVAANEAEALILEANLIKEYMPRYNVNFKDNKFYPFVKVTVKDEFPRIVFSRDQRRDGSLYFGPYTSAHVVRQYIDLVQRLFFIRTCYEMPKKECLNYHIKRCSGPCIHQISREDYRKSVDEAILFLSGNTGELLADMEKRMKEAASTLEFERAQAIKEKIFTVRMFEDSQSVFLPDNTSADFVGLAARMGKAVFVVTNIRGGKMVGKRSFSAQLPLEEEDMEEVLSQFVLEYVSQLDKKPEFLVIDKAYHGIIRAVEATFRKMGLPVIPALPGNDKEQSLSRMAMENANLHLMQVVSKVESSEGLKMLQEALELDTLPMRIEGFDIANILGENAVASMISFYAGKPDKKNYRHLKIRSKDSPDDFAMINEAVYRRYKRLRDEGQEFPDLILIDGGRGQLNAALEALAKMEVNLNVASLAKKNEEIYTPYRDKPLVLPKNSPALHILQQVRDETHRFANTFYNKLKGNDLLKSVFDKIPGIGEKRKKIIMQKFLNHAIIKKISAKDLIREGIPENIADRVLAELKRFGSE